MDVQELMTSSPVTVAPTASFDSAMELMEKHDLRHLPLVSKEGLVGVVSDRDLLDATGWLPPRPREILEAPEGPVSSLVRSPVVTASVDHEVGAALGLMLKQRIGALPVVRGDELVGIITEMDVFDAYATATLRGAIAPDDDPPISEFMTADPQTIAPDASCDEAAASFESAGARHLPVVDGNELVGILSDRDVRRERGRGRLELALVREAMSPAPYTASPGTGLSSAARAIYDGRIGALPILDGEKLVGIATSVDLLTPCVTLLSNASVRKR